MDLSLGSARPMLAAMSRCASFVEFSLMTVNATCPGLMCFNPSLREIDRKSTRLNSSHGYISYAVFCLKKKKQAQTYRGYKDPMRSEGATVDRLDLLAQECFPRLPVHSHPPHFHTRLCEPHFVAYALQQ